MYLIYSQTKTPTRSNWQTFKRREYIPIIQNLLWQIDSGMVRAITVHQDGSVTTLGLWSNGDIVGYPFAEIDSYQLECLSDVQIHRVSTDDCWLLNQVLLSHVHQSQALLRIRHGLMENRFKQFLTWLADRFGESNQNGCYIRHSLIHQDISETIDSTRVTVSRLIGKFEQQGTILWSKRSCWLYYNSEKQLSLTLP
ncbi:MAG: Crp/Fnr family transcriptional regulator [Cyanobacteria bacterium P01_E01_bin.35]